MDDPSDTADTGTPGEKDAPDARLETAQAFLREAVFRSRARQAALAGLAGKTPDAELAVGQCGLGKEAAVELDLSPRGVELANALWHGPLDAWQLARVQSVMRDWVRAQDALDRDRNHFLKAFRREHGFERASYTPELAARYDAGLETINGAANGALRVHAAQLLDETR
jgi:hypothetical protein